MKRRTRLRLALAAPWLLTADLCDWIGHAIYGRSFEVSDS